MSSKKMMITLEVDFVDMPEEVRKMCASMSEIDTKDLPKLEDYEDYQLAFVFNDIQINQEAVDYMFEGSNIFAEIGFCKVRTFEVIENG